MERAGTRAAGPRRDPGRRSGARQKRQQGRHAQAADLLGGCSSLLSGKPQPRKVPLHVRLLCVGTHLRPDCSRTPSCVLSAATSTQEDQECFANASKGKTRCQYLNISISGARFNSSNLTCGPAAPARLGWPGGVTWRWQLLHSVERLGCLPVAAGEADFIARSDHWLRRGCPEISRQFSHISTVEDFG